MDKALRFKLLRIFLAVTLFSGVALQSGTQVAEATAPLVVIDAGHGGYDPGAVGPTGYQEKVPNLGIAIKTKSALEALGYRVILTRSTDVALGPDLISDLQGRVDIANNNRADVFVSIHNNSAGAGAHGTETYYYRNPDTGAYDAKSKALATFIQQETVKRVATSDRGVKGANFFVLRRTNMPAALLEGAFISDPGEEELLRTAGFQQKLAEGMAAGIKAYFIQFGYTPSPVTRNYTLRPGTRTSVRLRDIAKGVGLSTKITSTVPIVGERSTYFYANGAAGTSTSIGAVQVAKTWFFPEGFTGSGFMTYIAIQNPGAQTAHVNLTFVDGTLPSLVKKYVIGPRSRQLVRVNDFLSNKSVATKVTADVPVVAERSMTFASDGSSSIGFPVGQLSWNFAEGSSKAGFDTWLLLENTGSYNAKATVRFWGASGRIVSAGFDVAAGARTSVRARNYLPDEDFAMSLRSDRPIVAERQEYVTYGGKTNGHSSVGTPYSAYNWYFAEGITGPPTTASKLVIWNPGSLGARVLFTFVKPDGSTVKKVTALAARQRRVLDAYRIVGSSTSFSLMIKSDQRIVAERTSYSSWGVSNSLGSRYLSRSWYFPDGSTAPGNDPWILLYNPTSQTAQVTLELQK